MVELTDIEVRVLGSLVEKALTTPEYYPLTLNALVNACNQKSNREPVVAYDAVVVNDALAGLREKALISTVMGGDSRVPKYRHYMDEAYGLTLPELAVMNVLMLRGPQTVGELRGRTERMYTFEQLSDVEGVLERLITRPDEPLVVKLPRLPGQKDARYAHLLSGMPEITEGVLEPAPSGGSISQRVQALEEEIVSLRESLQQFQEEFSAFKQQFE